jgi:hypothetical protein
MNDRKTKSRISNQKKKNMKTKNLIMMVAALALVAVVHVSFAQASENKPEASKENWVLLGSHVVDYTLDRDVISLKESTESYTGLKFKVTNGPINLHKCTVHFADGETQDVDFTANANANANAKERMVDLSGNTRAVEKITFWYDTKNSADKKAVVEVWGKSGQVN